MRKSISHDYYYQIMTQEVYDINPFIYNTSTVTIKINEEGQRKNPEI
jgi:hypothetical protein